MEHLCSESSSFLLFIYFHDFILSKQTYNTYKSKDEEEIVLRKLLVINYIIIDIIQPVILNLEQKGIYAHTTTTTHAYTTTVSTHSSNMSVSQQLCACIYGAVFCAQYYQSLLIEELITIDSNQQDTTKNLINLTLVNRLSY